MSRDVCSATEQSTHADKTDAELIEYGRDVIRNMKANGYHGIVWDELLDRFERLTKTQSANASPFESVGLVFAEKDGEPLVSFEKIIPQGEHILYITRKGEP